MYFSFQDRERQDLDVNWMMLPFELLLRISGFFKHFPDLRANNPVNHFFFVIQARLERGGAKEKLNE